MSRGRYGTDAWGLRFEASRESIFSTPEPEPEQTNEGMALHVDPFIGLCIHGKPDAAFKDGRLQSPHCEPCQTASY